MLSRLIHNGFLALAVLLAAAPAAAMEALDEEQLSEHTGEGLAFAFENFRFLMEPNSYIEQVGSSTPTNCPVAGCTATQSGPFTTAPTWRATDPSWTASGGFLAPDNANYMAFTRADLRWYGLSISSIALGTDWTEVACTSSGINNLGCPRGGAITNFASFDNPYVLRAFNYTDVFHDGTTAANTVLDLLAPSNQDNYRMTFWGEIEAGQGVGCVGAGCTNRQLKSQTIIQGSARNSVLRLFQTTEANAALRTLGLFYHSYLQGDFRFSVAQTAGSASDVEGTVVNFNPREGLHFRNVQAFLPLGQLNYQALTLDGAAGNNGNFFLELTAIPNTANVYNRFYSTYAGDPNVGTVTSTGASNGSQYGYATALCALRGGSFCTGLTVNTNYAITHGYSRWGDFFCNTWCANTIVAGRWDYNGAQNEAPINVNGVTVGTRNLPGDTNDGIIFMNSNAASNTFSTLTRRPIPCLAGMRNNCGLDARTMLNVATGAGLDGGWQNATTSGAGVNQFGNVARTQVNIGDARIEGIALNYLKITSLGAAYP